MIGIGDGMTARAIRKTSRIRSLWPSRDVKAPPAAPIPCAPIDPAADPARLASNGLTAHDLIAMARAARSRRGPL